jgi:hypothetical protein
MSLPYRSRPGAGFVVLVAGLCGAAAFFVWGLQTPRLEQVWRLQLELGQGTRGPLSTAEFALLNDALARHPELAADWLEGAPWRVLAADPAGRVEGARGWVLQAAGQAPQTLHLGAASPGEVRLAIRTADALVTRSLAAGQQLRHPLPPDPDRARLVEVTTLGGGALRLSVEAAR